MDAGDDVSGRSRDWMWGIMTSPVGEERKEEEQERKILTNRSEETKVTTKKTLK